ncbi:MAG: hypothetical protein J5677_01955 [Bacteroidales bacterium]|nr:hypothetical protein [Bacteroidales bacterium]MBR5092224.1 hypothetical protein [Bacteroidales bacterium]
MRLCVFNPEHDLCLAKGRWNYVPPRSAVDFARRDAAIMQVLYPDAHCCSVYDINSSLIIHHTSLHEVVAWGWDAVVKHELLKRGVAAELLPADEEINIIRELQHRSTVLPLQPDCHEVHSIEEMEGLLREREHWVMKAPWSGAGRGLRWVHGTLTAIDRDWLLKTVDKQRCVIAEPRRDVVADLALEYLNGSFMGYSYFKTGSGVYKENIAWTDGQIEATFSLLPVREHVERWLEKNVWPRYRGPLGVDLMACTDGSVHVAEMNFRHTMGMVAHEQLRVKGYEFC